MASRERRPVRSTKSQPPANAIVRLAAIAVALLAPRALPGIHPGRPAGPRSGVLLPRQPVAGGKNGSAYASRCRRDQPGRPIGRAQPIGRNVTKGRGPYDPAQSQEHLA
jgi:hypothetical protein